MTEPTGSDLHFRYCVPAVPLSLAFVRRSVSGLHSVLPDETIDAVSLILSELVTNCIRHAEITPHDEITVELEIGRRRVRGSVLDTGVGFTLEAYRAESREDGGYGLQIVDNLTRRWGVIRDNGTRVWFEI